VTSARRAWASAALALMAPAAALADSANLAGMADDLQRIQLQIAQGEKAAYAAQLSQLKTMGAAIATAQPETWTDKRQVDSLVVYILSGGSLADVSLLLKGDAVAESERALARGALAYVTNHEADAMSLLGKEDLNALDARLAGEVAFARSVLETKRDAKAAVEHLDWARVLAPGGLVEEAALRREIVLLAEGKDVGRAAMLTRQYATRFAASLYAADFFRDLAVTVARFGLADNPGDYQQISRAVASLPADSRRDFLLTLAKSALVNARFDAAAAAATEALEGVSAESPEAMRARLYLAASRMFSDAYDAAAADLRTIAVSKLDRADASLLIAVRRVAAELRIPPETGFVSSSGASLDDGDKEKDKASGPALTIERARDALDRTAGLVGGRDRGAQ
jgi:chemotaxis protein MotC